MLITGIKFQIFGRDGKPLAFGKVETYQSRTNIKKKTYKTADLQNENSNPVILNGEGYADICLDGDYKFVVYDQDNNELYTTDPVNDTGAQEWVSTQTIVYVSPTQFNVYGNFVAQFDENRRVRIVQGTGYVYGFVVDSSYAGGLTTVNISGTTITPSDNLASTYLTLEQNATPEYYGAVRVTDDYAGEEDETEATVLSVKGTTDLILALAGTPSEAKKFFVNAIYDINDIVGLSEGKQVQTIGKEVIDDGYSMLYRISATGTAGQDDIILSGANNGLIAFFVGMVSAKPELHDIGAGANFSENTPVRMQVKDNIAVWTGSVVVDTFPAIQMTGVIPTELQIKGYPGGNIILNMRCRVQYFGTGATDEKTFRVSQNQLIYEDSAYALAVGDVIYFDGLTYVVDVT